MHINYRILFGYLLLIYVSSISANSSFSSNNRTNLQLEFLAKAPEMTFDSLIIRREKIPYGGDGMFIFRFRNTGESPLIISKVNPSCGCIGIGYSHEPFQAGEVGEIEVRYDTKRIGPINKTVTVTSNASQPWIRLRIKGEVGERPNAND